MEFRTETEAIDVTRHVKPDPKHRGLCCCGDILDEATWWDHVVVVPGDPNDEYDLGHTECRHCRAVVFWPTVSVTERKFMQGVTRYFVDGEPVSADRYRELLEEVGRGDHRN